jgi:putative acetyltransferase
MLSESEESKSLLVIRRAEEADAEGILMAHRIAILSKAIQDYPSEIIEEWAAKVEIDRINHLKSKISDPDYIFFVADYKGDILGFSQAKPSEKELTACYTKPNAVGNVGTKLLKALEFAVYQAGFRDLEMDASINAVGFYQNHGYELMEHGKHQLKSGSFMACAKMRKTLDANNINLK